MGFGMDIAAAAMSMQAMQLHESYSNAVLKKGMDNFEQQAMALIDMVRDVPAPSQYNFDVRV